MKRRQGFVSNSSSSSFILLRDQIPSDVMESIKTLHDATDEYGRATGVIWDVLSWMSGLDNWGGISDIISEVIADHGSENLIIVRESDEGMGGYLSEYGINDSEIQSLAIREFEYH